VGGLCEAGDRLAGSGDKEDLFMGVREVGELPAKTYVKTIRQPTAFLLHYDLTTYISHGQDCEYSLVKSKFAEESSKNRSSFDPPECSSFLLR